MEKKTKITAIIATAAAGICVLAMPLGLMTYLLASPSVYDETFYGELPAMVEKLDKAEKNKIVIIGNSSVAFGLNPTVMEQEFQNVGLDYEVCPFGLYGSIGTRAMIELSKKSLKKGDIVILAPELYTQSLSTYFSAEDMWYSVESKPNLISRLSSESKQKMFGQSASFASKKFTAKKKAEGSGIYASANFDDTCVIADGLREGNTMANLYDPNTMITLSADTYSTDFISLMNDFALENTKKGIETFYSFAPSNSRAITNPQDEQKFMSDISSLLDMRIISSPMSKAYDQLYFYDTNFHPNDAGAKYHTLSLTEDLFNEWGISSPLMNKYPEAPDRIVQETEDTNNVDVACFEYELLEDDTYKVVALSSEGALRNAVVVPVEYEGKKVSAIEKTVFQNSNVEEVTIQRNIAFLYDNSFSGSKIKKIYITHTTPGSLGVGFHLLDECDAKICILKDYVSNFLYDYTWSYYSSSIEPY